MTKINTSGLEYIEISINIDNLSSYYWNMKNVTIDHIPGEELGYYVSMASYLEMPEQLYILFVELVSLDPYSSSEIYHPQISYKNSILGNNQAVMLNSFKPDTINYYIGTVDTHSYHCGKYAYGIILMNKLCLFDINNPSKLTVGDKIKIYIFPLSNFIKN